MYSFYRLTVKIVGVFAISRTFIVFSDFIFIDFNDAFNARHDGRLYYSFRFAVFSRELAVLRSIDTQGGVGEGTTL